MFLLITRERSGRVQFQAEPVISIAIDLGCHELVGLNREWGGDPGSVVDDEGELGPLALLQNTWTFIRRCLHTVGRL